MSKVTLYKCEACNNIVNHITKVYAGCYMHDLCDNCYKDISILEDMKHMHNAAISEINEMINKKVMEAKSNGKISNI